MDGENKELLDRIKRLAEELSSEDIQTMMDYEFQEAILFERKGYGFELNVGYHLTNAIVAEDALELKRG